MTPDLASTGNALVDATVRENHPPHDSPGDAARYRVALAELAERTCNLLNRAAKEVRPCRACGVTLYFIEHANGKIAPYTADAVNHFANCPKAKEFRRKA
ncbi:MAG TPA: hypothetical protein VH601_16705 [Bryobacteraceae bacterium]|jgi:hypothetical protein